MANWHQSTHTLPCCSLLKHKWWAVLWDVKNTSRQCLLCLYFLHLSPWIPPHNRFLLTAKPSKGMQQPQKAMTITDESCSVLYLTLRLSCSVERKTGGSEESGKVRQDFKACFQNRIFCLNPHMERKRVIRISWQYFWFLRGTGYSSNIIHIFGCL